MKEEDKWLSNAPLDLEYDNNITEQYPIKHINPHHLQKSTYETALSHVRSANECEFGNATSG